MIIGMEGRSDVLAEIRLTPPRRARRRMAGFVMPWILSRRILRWRLAPPLPRPLPPLPPVGHNCVSSEKADSEGEANGKKNYQRQ